MERNQEYLESRQELIDDCKNMSNKIKMYFGENVFTPDQLREEIERETEIGVEHIRMHIEAKKTIERLMKETKNK